jgi:hypothetical protein
MNEPVRVSLSDARHAAMCQEILRDMPPDLLAVLRREAVRYAARRRAEGRVLTLPVGALEVTPLG